MRYIAKLNNGNLLIRWERRTGQQAAPTEWRAGEVRIESGYYGKDGIASAHWDAPDGDGFKVWRDGAESPLEAVIALQAEYEKRLARAQESLREAQSAIDALNAASMPLQLTAVGG